MLLIKFLSSPNRTPTGRIRTGTEVSQSFDESEPAFISVGSRNVSHGVENRIVLRVELRIGIKTSILCRYLPSLLFIQG